MNRWGLTDAEVRMITETLSRFPEVQEARIFGSRAMGNFKPGSDVDIALFGTSPLNCITQVSRILNEEFPLPQQFDIIDFSQIENAELIAHIEQVGQRLYSKHS